MRLSEFYRLAIKLGSSFDPRGKRPWRYPDSAILFGSGKTEVRKIFVGIDIETGELLLADKLRRQEGLDLVVAHHPEGAALASLAEVMLLQVEMLKRMGISPAVAQQLVEERRIEVRRRLSSANHMRSVDTARILDLPFICLHTPADNLAAYFIAKELRKKQPKTLAAIIEILNRIPEYKEAAGNLSGPRIILGNPLSRPGKIFVEMTGGTEGSKKAFKSLARKGVRTLISMHLSEEHLKSVKDADLNVIIAGHVSSDTLGLNLLLDGIEIKEKLEVIACSGFRRFRRNARL